MLSVAKLRKTCETAKELRGKMLSGRLRYRQGDGIGSSPGGLEIEAASNAVDVEHLACEIKAGHMAALKG